MDFLERLDSSSLAQSIILSSIDSSISESIENMVKRNLLPFAVEKAMSSLNICLSLSNFQHDVLRGDGNESFMPESLPVPPEIDPYASGCLQVISRRKTDQSAASVFSRTESRGSEDDARSVASRNSTRSSASRSSRFGRAANLVRTLAVMAPDKTDPVYDIDEKTIAAQQSKALANGHHQVIDALLLKQYASKSSSSSSQGDHNDVKRMFVDTDSNQVKLFQDTFKNTRGNGVYVDMKGHISTVTADDSNNTSRANKKKNISHFPLVPSSVVLIRDVNSNTKKSSTGKTTTGSNRKEEEEVEQQAKSNKHLLTSITMQADHVNKTATGGSSTLGHPLMNRIKLSSGVTISEGDKSRTGRIPNQPDARRRDVKQVQELAMAEVINVVNNIGTRLSSNLVLNIDRFTGSSRIEPTAVHAMDDDPHADYDVLSKPYSPSKDKSASPPPRDLIHVDKLKNVISTRQRLPKLAASHVHSQQASIQQEV